jgi:hypothetical protein
LGCFFFFCCCCCCAWRLAGLCRDGNRRGVTVVEGDWLFGMAGGTVMCRNELREAPTPQ